MANKTNKFEFVHEEEIQLNAETRNIYYTKKNGLFVSDSLSCDKDTAKKLFDLIVKNNGEMKKTTVLETIEN